MPTIGELVGRIPGRYACPVCEAKFSELSDKKRHVRQEHPRKG